MQVEAVLFDLFDTLLLLENWESYYGLCLKKMHEFLVENNIKVSFEEFNRVYFQIRDKFYSESRRSLEEPHFNVRVIQTLQELGYHFDVSDPIVSKATLAFADEFTDHVQIDKNAYIILQELQKKFKLGLVSNFAIPECGRNLLKKYDMERFFDVIIISGEINQRKPSPKIFEKALQALNTDASKAVFVGDMLDLDVGGPKKVGIKTILIKRRPIEENNINKPDKVIENLTELTTILKDC